uniref:(northern house mosquito) hypothetical protein n=1 Tax=Culex pipiens TaxID=7175 RepID=A0A8D8AHB6_CULPI
MSFSFSFSSLASAAFLRFLRASSDSVQLLTRLSVGDVSSSSNMASPTAAAISANLVSSVRNMLSGSSDIVLRSCSVKLFCASEMLSRFVDMSIGTAADSEDSSDGFPAVTVIELMSSASRSALRLLAAAVAARRIRLSSSLLLKLKLLHSLGAIVSPALHHEARELPGDEVLLQCDSPKSLINAPFKLFSDELLSRMSFSSSRLSTSEEVIESLRSSPYSPSSICSDS